MYLYVGCTLCLPWHCINKIALNYLHVFCFLFFFVSLIGQCNEHAVSVLYCHLPVAVMNIVLMVFLSFRGKFAVVRKCVEKCTGHEYAAKIMRKRRKGQDCRMEIIHEIAVLELASACPHVVNLHQVYEMASEMVLVLEL